MICVRGRVRVILKNRGTIVVLQRYGLALCFLEVFGWWYYSGTSEVRMRYAHISSHLEVIFRNRIIALLLASCTINFNSLHHVYI